MQYVYIIKARYFVGSIEMAKEVKINTKGIKSSLKANFSEKKYYKSVAEYIWNGFDAQATEVELEYEFSSGGILKKLMIKDNGHGINHKELLKKFEPIFESDKSENKENNKNTSTYHGKNGVGRFTFFTFSNFATWTTVYEENGQNFKYKINISADSLELFTGVEEIPEATNDPVGTIVEFSNFKRQRNLQRGRNNAQEMIHEMMEHIKKQFCWYIELKKSFGYKLLVNGQELICSDLITEEEDFEILHAKSGIKFNVRYISWSKFIPEHSKFYYLDENYNEIYKENNTLNKKGDRFYQSVFISSEYFKDFNFSSDEQSNQKTIIGKARSDEIFKYLKEELNQFLRRKRKPFLKKYAQKIIKEFEDEGIIVRKNKTDFELVQIEDLENVVQEIYTTQPKVFNSLNKEQKYILAGLLGLVLNSDERERVIDIIDQIVKLDPSERLELSEILKVTNMTRIIKTLNLIKDRYEVMEILKQVLFNPDLGANEVDHLQKIVENHTWIFGEKYSLVAAAEDNFEVALRNHIKILTDKEENVCIDHPNKLKQVDIFICRQEKSYDNIHNLIIELKHPQKRLCEANLSQVKKYMQTILEIDRFNADNYTWDFLLVGNKFDNSGFIEGELENVKRKGESGLVYQLKNYKIYVRKWSEILNDCDLRHKFLQEKLELERNNLVKDLMYPDEAVQLAKDNSAVLT